MSKRRPARQRAPDLPELVARESADAFDLLGNGSWLLGQDVAL